MTHGNAASEGAAKADGQQVKARAARAGNNIKLE